MTQISRNKARLKRKVRIRKKISGTPDCPRLSVFRSHSHLSAQLIDDSTGHTLLSVSTNNKGKNINAPSTLAAAKEVGKLVGEGAKKLDIQKVVFDRSGYRFHGRVAAMADAAREAGLKF